MKYLLILIGLFAASETSAQRYTRFNPTDTSIEVISTVDSQVVYKSKFPKWFKFRVDSIFLKSLEGTETRLMKASSMGFVHAGNQIIFDTATLDFPPMIGGAAAEINRTITGAALADFVILGIPNAAVTSRISFDARVSAANTVTIRAFNFDVGGSQDPASALFNLIIIKP